MRWSRSFAAVVLVGLSLGFGLASGAGAAAGGGCHPETTENTTGAGTTVDISKCRMNPTVLQVDAGDTVTFVNNDDYGLPHNIFGLDWGIDQLDLNGSFTHRFDEAGIQPYACTLHPGMVGAIVVGDGGGETAAALPINSGGDGGGGSNGIIVASVVGVMAFGVVTAAIAFGVRRRGTAAAPVSP